jgi:hypothetical protein
MTLAVFEPAILVLKSTRTIHALDGAATVTGKNVYRFVTLCVYYVCIEVARRREIPFI